MRNRSARRRRESFRRPSVGVLLVPALAAISVLAFSGCSAQTQPADGVTPTSAVLHATLYWNDGDGPSAAWFQYRTDNDATWSETSHDSFPKTSCSNNPCSQDYSRYVDGLLPSTHYVYRLCGWTTKTDGTHTPTVCYDSTKTAGGTNYSSFTTPGRFSGLEMGFGEQTGANWLQLDNATSTHFDRNSDGTPDSVAEYLDYDQANWVVAMEEWKGLANGNGYAALRDWAQNAANNDKSLLFTIGWNPPTDPPNDYADQYGFQPVPSQDAQDNLRDVAHNVWLALHGDAVPGGDYSGGGADLTGDVRLEIGTESNYNSGQDGKIWPIDARFWWDAINRIAHDSYNDPNPWPFGKGIVTGGPFTKPGGDNFGWGSGWVNARTYLKAAVGGRQQGDPWTKHWDHPYFDAYGIHAGHRSDLDKRTTWGGPDGTGGIQERVNLVTNALSDANVPSNTNIEITALLPTDTTADTDAAQQQAEAQQTDDTTPIWNQLRSGNYAHAGQYPLNLVIWNHIVDTGQDNFPCTGFMEDPNDQHQPDSACQKFDTSPTGWPYQGKDVWSAAHNWLH
jgi:hypothetical protein